MMFREVEQVDIAPSIASILGISIACEGKPVNEIVRYAHYCKNVLLAIVDSLGFKEYVENRHSFSFLASMERCGYMFKCLSYTHLTTPSIASILCGSRPEKHNIVKTIDAYTEKVKCLPEIAYEMGFRVAIVMEEYGALSFQGLVSLVKPIADVPNVLEFDEESCRKAIEALKELNPDLLVVHLRSLDVLGFTRLAMLHVDNFLKSVAEQVVSETVFFVIGDHPPHNRTFENHVALIVFKVKPRI
ncbi:MAG: sulfatase-like hydrolase/transferase [Candidatus Nezhaarchaeales archaeon]|nr:MAG: hypothetical protein DSO05_05470 [Candidatus Nezhaarchaeota archaeon WYZ-LMO7]